jgi:hypothetical protein
MKVAKLLLQRYGYRVLKASVKYDGTKELNYLTVL